MVSDSSDHPSVMCQVPSPWSLVLGLAGLMCKVLVPRSRCKGLGRTMPQVSGLMSQVLVPRFQAPGSKSLVPGPKSRVHQCLVPARSQLLVLACDYWTDIQIMAGFCHRHDRKLLLAA